MANPKAEGASKSLNTTITDIMKHLNDDGRTPGPNEGGFRAFLYEKLGELTEKAFKKGFNRGHKESYDTWKESGKVPKVLRFKAVRKLSPGKPRTIKAKSKISKGV